MYGLIDLKKKLYSLRPSGSVNIIFFFKSQ